MWTGRFFDHVRRCVPANNDGKHVEILVRFTRAFDLMIRIICGDPSTKSTAIDARRVHVDERQRRRWRGEKHFDFREREHRERRVMVEWPRGFLQHRELGQDGGAVEIGQQGIQPVHHLVLLRRRADIPGNIPPPREGIESLRLLPAHSHHVC